MILIVCEGNVCRSPVAAALLQAALPDAGLEVASAGTRALVGRPVEPDSARAASRFGVDVSGHRGRQVTAELVGQAQLILTATRRVRGELVGDHPAAVRRSFTIRQFDRILSQATEPFVAEDGPAADQVRALTAFLARHRTMPVPADPTVDDVVDPYRQPVACHELAVQQMLPGLSKVSLAFGGRPISALGGRPIE